MLAAVVLADPAVRQCFEATAQTHGVDDLRRRGRRMEDADARAEQIKSVLASLQSKLDKLNPG